MGSSLLIGSAVGGAAGTAVATKAAMDDLPCISMILGGGTGIFTGFVTSEMVEMVQFINAIETGDTEYLDAHELES